MHDLLAVAGLLFAAAATPGPNNLVVLHEAGRGGMRAAGAAIGGIVLGGLALFAAAAAGLGGVLARHGGARTALGVAGALYMGWLGLGLVRIHGMTSRAATALPTGMPGLFGFQFLNPKGWAMALTVVAAWPATRAADYLPLALLFTFVPLVCLLLWAMGGRWLATRLACPRFRRRADAAMGLLLLASAALLLAGL
ncbi:MAG TPA: LysE family transporter [Frateuria sp.]|uniref:LysE family translocator n=1 Tax=Frateuria sp. TaxID=2211372 RepID=UPI002DE8F0EE|nr:LysE family transporter [Frateuria sp.]